MPDAQEVRPRKQTQARRPRRRHFGNGSECRFSGPDKVISNGSTGLHAISTLDHVHNLTPAEVYFGPGENILAERKRIKRQTLHHRRLNHRRQAA
jgi:hypothetical protein